MNTDDLSWMDDGPSEPVDEGLDIPEGLRNLVTSMKAENDGQAITNPAAVHLNRGTTPSAKAEEEPEGKPETPIEEPAPSTEESLEDLFKEPETPAASETAEQSEIAALKEELAKLREEIAGNKTEAVKPSVDIEYPSFLESAKDIVTNIQNYKFFDDTKHPQDIFSTPESANKFIGDIVLASVGLAAEHVQKATLNVFHEKLLNELPAIVSHSVVQQGTAAQTAAEFFQKHPRLNTTEAKELLRSVARDIKAKNGGMRHDQILEQAAQKVYTVIDSGKLRSKAVLPRPGNGTARGNGQAQMSPAAAHLLAHQHKMKR